jgi:hypothetical protein
VADTVAKLRLCAGNGAYTGHNSVAGKPRPSSNV